MDLSCGSGTGVAFMFVGKEFFFGFVAGASVMALVGAIRETVSFEVPAEATISWAK